MTEIFAYFRVALADDNTEDVVAAFAAGYGVELPEIHFFGEAVPPVMVLWTVLTTMDHAHSTAHSQRVADYAYQRGTLIEQLVNAPAPCPALWGLIAAATEAGGGIVVVPGPEHLEGFGAPGPIVEQQLRAIPSTRLVYLTPTPRS
ncbi:hypothetical protein [Nocardia camponoti]|uniref:Uncharacterized protein n=1 Tax=Nocardia camponoti TaxID=1616106 RepID=A0A917QV99_9NOCA|nr:hypothetical protein [Nocardia camponoti]GGK69037.1 hypothetical protein GCM10011591_46450 [Nocardia camponoti]